MRKNKIQTDKKPSAIRKAFCLLYINIEKIVLKYYFPFTLYAFSYKILLQNYKNNINSINSKIVRF